MASHRRHAPPTKSFFINLVANWTEVFTGPLEKTYYGCVRQKWLTSCVFSGMAFRYFFFCGSIHDSIASQISSSHLKLPCWIYKKLFWRSCSLKEFSFGFGHVFVDFSLVFKMPTKFPFPKWKKLQIRTFQKEFVFGEITFNRHGLCDFLDGSTYRHVHQMSFSIGPKFSKTLLGDLCNSPKITFMNQKLECLLHTKMSKLFVSCPRIVPWDFFCADVLTKSHGTKKSWLLGWSFPKSLRIFFSWRTPRIIS